MAQPLRYELYIERDDLANRSTTLYAEDPDGQMRLVGSEEWGPFDTDLERAQWVWRNLTRDLALHLR